MTWGELERCHPNFRTARAQMRAQLDPLVRSFGVDAIPDGESEVDFESLMNAALWIALHDRDNATKWVELFIAEDGGVLVRYFKSNAGEIVRLPNDFVVAFLAGKPLDIRLEDFPRDPSYVRLLRAGKDVAVFRKSLLDHLTDVRARAGRAG